MLSSKPNFIVAGVQKGGTTSLYRYLAAHPNVLRSHRKELGYFGDQYYRGESWYKQQFPTLLERSRMALRARSWVQTGEATPYYLFHPLAAARVQAYCPAAKVIVMLRDPVERAYSHYRHHVKLGEEVLSFEEALAAEDERLLGQREAIEQDKGHDETAYRLYSYKTRGQYAEQLKRWFACFDRKSMLIMSSESFFADPGAAFRKTQKFLGLPVRDHDVYEQFNPGKKEGMPSATRAELEAWFRPQNEELFELLGETYDWS